jgi:hypothetical protein
MPAVARENPANNMARVDNWRIQRCARRGARLAGGLDDLAVFTDRI